MVGQQLQRDDGHDRLQELGHGRHADDIVGQFDGLRIVFVDDRDHRPAAGLDLFHVRDHFAVHAALRHDEYARRLLVDQRDRPVFHFGGRVAFGVDVADFLELESAFQGRGEIELPAQVEEVVARGILGRDAAGFVVGVERFFDVSRQCR